MEIVFRKRITGDHFQLGGEGHVLNRYKLAGVKRRFAKAEIAVIAALLYQNDYEHPFTDDEGVYWTLE